MLEPEDLRVGYTHVVSGPQWIDRYLHAQRRIDELHQHLYRRFYADVEAKGLTLVTPPTLTTEFDEQRHMVVLHLEAWGRDDRDHA